MWRMDFAFVKTRQVYNDDHDKISRQNEKLGGICRPVCANGWEIFQMKNGLCLLFSTTPANPFVISFVLQEKEVEKMYFINCRRRRTVLC